MKLAGKRAIITGCSQGLGAVIAEAMWNEGADLLLVARSGERLQELRTRLSESRNGGQVIHVFRADLREASAPQEILNEARRIWSEMEVLVNNAGVIGPIGMVADNDWCQWRDTIQVNLLAPAELCQLAIQWMQETGSRGSIINLSGGGAATPRPRFSAYATAKCGLVRFTETVASEVASAGIRLNCVAPGPMNTSMLQQTLVAGADAVGQDEYVRVVKFTSGGATDPQVAADLVVYLASTASAGITGKLISAVWDPWRRLHDFAGEIQDSDIYTLRRIVPEDRGKVAPTV